MSVSLKKPVIGVFGGTFDPIHQGHMSAIDLLCDELEFDQVRWVLSARPPHKEQVSATVDERFEMLQIALRSNSKYVADDAEIKRVSKSYTVDTVKSLQLDYPNSKIVLIIGADSLLNLSSWHRYEELVEQVNWVVMSRPGYQITLSNELQQRFSDNIDQFNASESGAFWLFEQPNFDISSTQIRAQLARQAGIESTLIKECLATDVIEYIHARQLYKIVPMKSEQIKDQVVEALENVKGQDIKVIDISEISSFADFMIVASGTSDTHVKALARSASDDLRRQGIIPLNEDGADVGEWVLVDFGDVVLHVMRPEVREYYALEQLWDEDVRRLVEQHRENGED